MQLAILVVLVIIAVILAPWLVGVAVALAAAYGLWLVAAAVLTFVAMLVLALVLSPLAFFNRRPSAENALRERNKEFNRKYMEEARLKREKAERADALRKAQENTDDPGNLTG